MSEVSLQTPEAIDRPTLADLLTRMQFKTVLLVTCGLTNCQIAEFLGTRESVVRNVLKDIYERTGCCTSDELVLRYFHEVANGLLELGRLKRELAELEARRLQSLYTRPQDGPHYIN